MMEIALLRGALWSFSALFGGLGVFFLYFSFSNPNVAAYALMFLGTAAAIVFSTQDKDGAVRRRPRRGKRSK